MAKRSTDVISLSMRHGRCKKGNSGAAAAAAAAEAGGDIKRRPAAILRGNVSELRVRPQSVLTKSRFVNGASPAYDVWVANSQFSRNPVSFGPCYHILFNVKL